MPERVLVVDSADDIRQFLTEKVLNPKGYEVMSAANALEGLAMAVSKEPDLLIVELQMPRLSGLELLQRLADRGLEIPAILLTSQGTETFTVDSFRLGIKDFVVKPLDSETISAAIERALHESRLQQERDELVQQLLESNSQLERRLQELNILYGIGKAVSTSLDVDEVLRRVTEAAVYLTSAEEGFLMLLDKEEGELFVRASKNLDSVTQSMRLRAQDSLAGRVLQTRRPLVIGAEGKWQQIKTAYLVKSVIYIPLLTQDDPIGVLTVVNRLKEAPFDNRDVRVLAALADYAAVAIYNANLYSQSDRERNKLNTVLSQTDNPVLIVDERGKVTMANNAARALLELPGGEIAGDDLDKLIDNQELLEFIVQAAGQLVRRHHEFVARDGRIFDVSLTLIENVGRSIVMHDISQLKELDRLKSELVAVVSHDLRSPLTAILSYIDLMTRTGILSQEQEDFARRIRHSVGQITALVSDLLDLGRLEAGFDLTLMPCSVAEILTQIEEELKPTIQEKNLRYSLAIPNKSPVVQGDRQRLHQCFSNLIGNAVKYTLAGESVRVTVEQQDEQIVVSIADTGIGIAASDQPYIFDKFFRADAVVGKNDGTGLGLSIVKSAIERHQGRIWVTSELGKGSTFTVLLPAAGAVLK